MLRIHYYRYDQDYSGWDLWLWENGREGKAYLFNRQELLDADNQKVAKVAEIDVSNFNSREIGFIVRRGGWSEKDISYDRYITLPDNIENGAFDIYLVQDTPEIFDSEDKICLCPGFNTVVFENFREIFVRLQTPCKNGHEIEPFQVYEDGQEIPVRHVTARRGNRDFVISLVDDMKPGCAYMVYKPGYRLGYVDYGMIYDTPEFEQLFTYEGDDLGANWSKDCTVFKAWAPTASAMFLNLYNSGTDSTFRESIEMKKEDKGVWTVRVPGDLSGIYYTYSVMVQGKTWEVADPYARSSGVNGLRSMVVDVSKTNPEGWEHLTHKHLTSPTAAVLYEVHIRDITIHPSSGATHRGKYLGLAEKDTRSPENLPTGLSHMMELGVTHVHLMPFFDFVTIDEEKPLDDQYNWGYDPLNFNVPEGSYSTNPHNGYVRVSELKQMIKAIKESGMGVVMDVVYNHTYKTCDSDFNKLVPGYYYRSDRFGNFSNGSGCGNEIASERSMVRRFIVESVKRWATEYKIDGFRFDLMGLLDLDTMREIRTELDKISPSILLYGEGWTGGPSLLDRSEAATKSNAPKLDRIGFFNDNTRDGIKGDAFHAENTGFISGNLSCKESVKFGVVGGVSHPGIDYSRVNYSGFAWAGSAWHCVNYAASHDNLTLYDKLLASRPDLSEWEHVRLVNLAAAIVLTSQGIPFLMLGTDMMRSKKGDHNSYKSPDSINQIDWTLKSRYYHVFNYHKGLIALRKAHPAFQMANADDIRRNLTFCHCPEWMIAFYIDNHANNDPWETVFVVYNAGVHPESINLPKEGPWHVVVNENKAGLDNLETITGHNVTVPARSAMVLYRNQN